MPPLREPQLDTSPLRLYHHYIYIVVWTLLASIVLYVPGGLTYINALLLASGAATQTGLNPVDLNRLHVAQQVILWLVPMVTNVVFMHSLLVLIRLYWFRKRFRGAIHDAKAVCRSQRSRMNQHLRDLEINRPVVGRSTIPDQPILDQPILDDSPNEEPVSPRAKSPHIMFDDERTPDAKARRRSISTTTLTRRRSLSDSGFETDTTPTDRFSTFPPLPSLMWQSSIASYSDWDETQKEELGGIEYRALKTLLVILVCYFLAFHLLGIALFIPWTLVAHRDDPIFARIGVPGSWWAVFTAASAFNDLGYTLTPDSMASFRTSPLPLLVMTVLIVAGNTGFPCLLRLIIWLLSKLTTYGTPLDEELHYLLDHPRRCFTLLFPGAETRLLAAVLLLLNAIDLLIFYTLQEVSLPTQFLPSTPPLTPQTPTNPISPGIRLVNGLFQIASTRTAGFTITSLGALHPAVQVTFLMMMYIAAFPLAITIRKTNVYEEKSLGIYHDTDDEDHTDDNENSPKDDNSPHAHRGLTAHIQRQLGFDLWYVMLGFFTVAVAEGSALQEGDRAFALFPVLFEIVSAYGTVGLSLGSPGVQTSLCAKFGAVGKVVVIAMQVRGRHRGLPHALDHAILLPCEVHQGEGWWWQRWLKRRGSLSGLFVGDDGGDTAAEDRERERLLP